MYLWLSWATTQCMSQLSSLHVRLSPHQRKNSVKICLSRPLSDTAIRVSCTRAGRQVDLDQGMQ